MTSHPRTHSYPAMTSRERVTCALQRQPHDRVPRHDSYWPETIQRWEQEGLVGGAEGALRTLGSDFQGCCWYWPVPFPGRRELLSQDGETESYINANGAKVRYWRNRSGVPEHLGFTCTDPAIWQKEFRPSLVDQPIQLDLAAALASCRSGREAERWTYFAGVEPFEMLRALVGDEGGLMAMIDDPDWVQDIAEVGTTNLLRNFQAAWEAGARPDGLWIYGDMAYNHATVCSPALYRDLIWPQHKRIVDWARERGLKTIFHTDGDVRAVLSLYQSAGFDAIQPMEAKAAMDLRELAPRHGPNLSFFGNIDVRVMIRGQDDELEQEVSSKLKAAMPFHGYLYHSDHSVPPQVSWSTYLRLIHLLDRYGNYADGPV